MLLRKVAPLGDPLEISLRGYELTLRKSEAQMISVVMLDEGEGKMTEIALIGNPNSGKTSLFNLITGNNQRVGNWPGVTVERKVVWSKE